MSWSNRWIGKVEAVKAAMDRYAEKLTVDTRAEFELAKPHLVGLLDQNTGGGVVDLDANGHAYIERPSGQRIAQCNVTLKTLGVLCE